jgi:hypothetical protein
MSIENLKVPLIAIVSTSETSVDPLRRVVSLKGHVEVRISLNLHNQKNSEMIIEYA